MIRILKNDAVFCGKTVGMYDHILVEEKLNVIEEWRNKVRECMREVLKVEEVNNLSR